MEIFVLLIHLDKCYRDRLYRSDYDNIGYDTESFFKLWKIFFGRRVEQDIVSSASRGRNKKNQFGGQNEAQLSHLYEILGSVKVSWIDRIEER